MLQIYRMTDIPLCSLSPLDLLSRRVAAKGLVIQTTFLCNLSCSNAVVQVAYALPPLHSTNFFVAKSRSSICGLQHKNFLCKEGVTHN